MNRVIATYDFGDMCWSSTENAENDNIREAIIQQNTNFGPDMRAHIKSAKQIGEVQVAYGVYGGLDAKQEHIMFVLGSIVQVKKFQKCCDKEFLHNEMIDLYCVPGAFKFSILLKEVVKAYLSQTGKANCNPESR